MKNVLRILLVLMSFVLVGCVQSKDEFTINPDGSGKVIEDITVDPSALGMMQGMVNAAATQAAAQGGGQAGAGGAMTLPGGGSQDPVQQCKDLAMTILDKSKGVDTWSDVSVELTSAGKMHFHGTAYFPDIQALKFNKGGMEDEGRIEFTKNADGTITLTAHNSAKNQQAAPTPTPAQQLSDAEINQKIKEVRAQYTQSKMMMQMFLGELSSDTIIHMPGSVTKATIFQKTGDNTVQVTVRGADMLAGLDKKMQDDAFLRDMIVKGVNPMGGQGGGPDDLTMNEIAYGQRQLAQVTSAAGAPLFDYQAEVAAAKAGYDQMVANLTVKQAAPSTAPANLDSFSLGGTAQPETVNTATTAPAPAAATAAGNVEIYGVRLLRISDSLRGVLPGGSKNGYTVSLVGKLPEAAVAVTGGTVTKATTDTVQNLVPASVWDRKIRLARLASDNQTALFDVQLLTPDPDARGLQELSGTLQYLTAGGSKAVDLGNMKLEAGSKGSDLGATVVTVGKDPFDKNPAVLTLSVNLKPEEIESVEIKGTQAKMVDKEAIGDTTLVRCAVGEGSLPASGQIVVNVYEGLQSNNFAFSVSGVSLTGGQLR